MSRPGDSLYFVLYTQAVHDVEAGWIRATKQEQRQLSGLKAKKSKKEVWTGFGVCEIAWLFVDVLLQYVQLVRTLKHYNYIQVLPCLADFPIEAINATVSLGPSELCLEVTTKTVSILLSVTTPALLHVAGN